ncbi:MAG: metal-dependent hydrolase [Candidatus Dormibacteraeota bacterium]|nr:metal-dependent hydrolase [Candidatus Dormibacteraeota bacterium]
MRALPHVLIGSAAAIPVAIATRAPAPVVAGAVLGSLLPDLDSPHSTVGRWLHLPLRHRGPLHSLLAAAIAALVAWLVLRGPWRLAAVGLAIGYVAHLLADSLTGRVPLLWPARLRRRR